MSQENVEIVREIADLARRVGDSESSRRLLGLFAPDVHLDMSRRVFNPATYDGYAGLRRFAKSPGRSGRDSPAHRNASSTPAPWS